MKRLESPCKDCGNREVGCHAKCKAYQEFAADRKEVYQQRYEAVVLDTVDIHKKRKKWQLKRSEGDAVKSYRHGF